jgi:hypothetical protein
MKKAFASSAALVPLVFLLVPLALFGEGGQDPSAPLPQTNTPTAEELTLKELFDIDHWITRPSGSVITIIGIASRKPNRNAAIQEAVADAARKAALYHGVYAKSTIVMNEGRGSLEYFTYFDFEVMPENGSEGYIESLVFDTDTDVLEKNGLVIVRTRYSGVSDVPPYKIAVKDGVPEWVANIPPEIPGLLVGIGHSANKGSRRQTHAASYEHAIVTLLPQLSTRVEGEVVDTADIKIRNNTITSEGRLVNVMILETWYDQKTSSAWTLIAAKEKL